MMDYSDFPEPYNEEVPRRIAEAREDLSPEGVAVLEDLVAEESEGTDDPLDDFVLVSQIRLLPESESNTILGLLPLLQEAYTAAADASATQAIREQGRSTD